MEPGTQVCVNDAGICARAPTRHTASNACVSFVLSTTGQNRARRRLHPPLPQSRYRLKATYTDDTQMALAVRDSLVECKRFDPGHMAGQFARLIGDRDRGLAWVFRGSGRGTHVALKQVRGGVDWLKHGRYGDKVLDLHDMEHRLLVEEVWKIKQIKGSSRPTPAAIQRLRIGRQELDGRWIMQMLGRRSTVHPSP